MIRLRPAAERGHADHGWLQTWHSFSFADYFDPAEMGWGPLRVINDDVIAAGAGFPPHGHRDMEIITLLLDGQLEHRDSMGNGAIIGAGEAQYMCAGSGVQHSEFNPASDASTHLLQIWIRPRQAGLPPAYGQFQPQPGADGWALIASADGAGGSLRINQDASLRSGSLAAGAVAELPLAAGRLAYVHLIDGALRLNGVALTPGDGAKVAEESQLRFEADAASRVLVFDLPG